MTIEKQPLSVNEKLVDAEQFPLNGKIQASAIMFI
jgi:hypothetical protein